MTGAAANREFAGFSVHSSVSSVVWTGYEPVSAMTRRLTIQLAYHLWAEATSSDWNWEDADEVQGKLRCYLCGLPSSDTFHDNKAPHWTHSYEPGVVVAI